MEVPADESENLPPSSTAGEAREASARAGGPLYRLGASERRQRIDGYPADARISPSGRSRLPRPAGKPELAAHLDRPDSNANANANGSRSPHAHPHPHPALAGPKKAEGPVRERPPLSHYSTRDLMRPSASGGAPDDLASRMKILIVDDHGPTVNVLKRTLEMMGYEALIAGDGEEAWSLLGRGHVPLVISDWVMPGLDGLELCRRIRGRGKDRYTYIVLVTGRVGDEDRLIALDAGADDFLAKPVDIRELAARLKIARRILAMQEELERKNAELIELASTDALTGLRNRRWFGEALEAHLSLAVRQGTPLSLVLLDVDHFKSFNDAFGHPMGDGVLWAVAQVLRENARLYDVVARYGGEEFAILLPATCSEAGVALAERMRAAIEQTEWPLRTVTASLGVSTLTSSRPGSSDLVGEADRALYHSKRLGRNRVSRFDDTLRLD